MSNIGKVKVTIDRVLTDAGQTTAYRRQFARFFENLTTNNVDDSDLEDLIDQVTLPEDD